MVALPLAPTSPPTTTLTICFPITASHLRNQKHHVPSFPRLTIPFSSSLLSLLTSNHKINHFNRNNIDNNNNNNGSNNNNGNNNNNNKWWDPPPDDNDNNSNKTALLLLLLLFPALLTSARAVAKLAGEALLVWEVNGGRRTLLVPDSFKDSFTAKRNDSDGKSKSILDHAGLHSAWGFLMMLMLPDGYPNSVTADYLEYSLWRGVQGIASQVTGVLSTQALLYAVGLGKGAIPTAAAINWVLKDGIGYISKIMLSNFGRHFDVNPKGWRLFADLLENAAYGLEILTPAFPHLFVPIGAVAGAGRSAAFLIQAATRSCFYAGFAAQRNFAEVIAKGEAQGMVSKFIGLVLGIALGNYVGSSTPSALAYFVAITGVHMYCNFKSYKSIQLRTLNPYRASLVFSQYLLTGEVPPVKEVNDEEPFFPFLPIINIGTHNQDQLHVLSIEAKDAAAAICSRLQLGSKLSEVVNDEQDAVAMFSLFRDEQYLLAEDQRGRFCVFFKENSSPEVMLKSLFHVNYLYWLERNVGIRSANVADDCQAGGRLQISLEYVLREFSHVKYDGLQTGWVTDGLIARPLPNRIRPVYSVCS